MVQMHLTLMARRGCAADLVQALHSLALSVQAESTEARCAVFLEACRPESVCYVEEWPDEEGLNDRVRSGAFLRLLAVMETAVTAPTLEFRFVSATRGLDYVEQVRQSGAARSGR